MKTNNQLFKVPFRLDCLLLLTVILSWACLPSRVGAQESTDSLVSGVPPWLQGLSERELRAEVGFLASPELAGRKVLEPGSRIAAAYISARFEALGLQPAGDRDQGFFQDVPLIRARADGVGSVLALEPVTGDPLILRLGEDLGVRLESPLGFDVRGSLLFAGYGISAPEYGYDDYLNLDTTGRVLLVLAGEPSGEAGDKDYFRGGRLTRHGIISTKRKLAQKHGAAAVLVVPVDDSASSAQFACGAGGPEFVGRAEGADEDSLPLFVLSASGARKLVELIGGELPVPVGGTAAGAAAQSVLPLAFTAHCRLAVSETEERPTRNVLGILRGSDANLFPEFVLLSAHYDHLGRRPDGEILPGADDNASGVAALLAAAEAFARLPESRRPRRSLLFAAWGGEEAGVLGSGHFLDHPAVPLGRIRVVLNLDMVGRDNMALAEYANVAAAIYSAQAPDLEMVLDDSAQRAGIDLRLLPGVLMHGASDHRLFHLREIPVVHFFTGWHDDYNQPGDRAERINYDKLLRISRMVAELAFIIADGETVPCFDPAVTTPAGRSDPFQMPF